MFVFSQFPKRLLDEEELREVGVSECVNHLEGMKRYREFDQFHSSLVKSPLSVYIKGITLLLVVQCLLILQ